MNKKLIALLVILPLFWLAVGWDVLAASEWHVESNLAHNHNVASQHPRNICGDHICKPGETYNP